MNKKLKLERKLSKLKERVKAAYAEEQFACDRMQVETTKWLYTAAFTGAKFSNDYCDAEKFMYKSMIKAVRLERLIAHTARKLGLEGYTYPPKVWPIAYVAEEWKLNA